MGPHEGRDPSNEIVQVGHLGEDVVADHEVGRSALSDERTGEVAAEELCQCRDAAGLGRCGDVAGRLDAQGRDAARNEVLQQVAVVASQLNNQARRPEAETGDHRLPVVPRELDPAVRVRRKVGVLAE
jgi:hypothetical protein